jgi:hypothetical protein
VQPPSSSGFLIRHRFVWLFAALLLFLLVAPIVHRLREVLHPTTPPIVEAICFVAVVAAAVVSISTTRTGKLIALGLGLPTALLGFAHGLFQTDPLAIVRHAFAAAFLVYAIVAMFRHIFVSERVRLNTVSASLCIYMLLGVVWALAYSIVDVLEPAAFYSSLPSGSPRPPLRLGSGESTAVLYFSYCTLTTLGYGDIVPTSPITRGLASLEAITGQLYLTTLVARLVGLHIADSMAQKSKPPEP